MRPHAATEHAMGAMKTEDFSPPLLEAMRKNCTNNILYIYLYFKNYFSMQITTVSDFRKDMKTYLDRVVKNFETLIINRGKDSGIVVMSLQEYNSLMATNHELSSRKNELRLDSAINKLKNGKTFNKDLIDN
jgi:antitoxin YefM